LPSSRATSNGPDATDFAEALRAFQDQNRVRIVITVRAVAAGGTADFWLDGKALSEVSADGVRSLLAFASVKCLGSRHRTTDAALLALLYALDFQLAENEFAKVKKAD
jgi:hypothetical protein